MTHKTLALPAALFAALFATGVAIQTPAFAGDDADDATASEPADASADADASAGDDAAAPSDDSEAPADEGDNSGE